MELDLHLQQLTSVLHFAISSVYSYVGALIEIRNKLENPIDKLIMLEK